MTCPSASPFAALHARLVQQLPHIDPVLRERLQHDGLHKDAQHLWLCSHYALSTVQRYPELLIELLDQGALHDEIYVQRYRALLDIQLQSLVIDDEAGLLRLLRRFRHQQLLRILWRDLNGLSTTEQSLHDLSALAACLIDGALNWQHCRLSQRYGTPRGRDGSAQQLVVLGMGKLGGGELNFSSDIDLIFAHVSPGSTDGVKSLDNAAYFKRLGQALISALSEVTEDGFVYRVDMRLRPFGSSGPLVAHFEAIEDYYLQHGRDWERYALIKARVVAGDHDTGQALLNSLRPFVYRRYLDYSAFEALRDMKGMIDAEVSRKGMAQHLKLGPGGIREVEFIVQAFQLIYGGRDLRLQRRHLPGVLARLVDTGHLDQTSANALLDAYLYLRRCENRLQAIDDQQRHRLPDSEPARSQLCLAMGEAQWSDLLQQLQTQSQIVSRQFDQLFRASGERDQQALLSSLWQGRADHAQTLRDLGLDAEQAQRAFELLQRLHEDSRVRAMSSNGRARLDRLMPRLLQLALSGEAPLECLERSLNFIAAVARRSVYLALLADQKAVLEQLIPMFRASPWVAELMARHPILLDDLLNPETLRVALDRAQLRNELNTQLRHLPREDDEALLDLLRHFRQSQTLRLATCDLNSHLTTMRISDGLTAVAEIILEVVLEVAQSYLLTRHGQPCLRREDGGVHHPHLSIVAYGKLGGLELGYGSDLDIVFVHDAEGGSGATNGRRSLDNSAFFARLAQRMIHMLTATTAAGGLYEVDTRLRPSGRSGLMVTGLEAFGRYQREQAWTWEHQALLRTRMLCGDSAQQARFAAIRRDVLCRARPIDVLREEVSQMREKMRQHLGSQRKGQFHLKQDRGGIADIEFIVQFLVLAHAAQHPELIEYSDNVRQLDAIARCSLLSEADAKALHEAYLTLRQQDHQLTLQQAGKHLPDDLLRAEREVVQGIWQQVMVL